jgi:superfamily II DNA or RNA helicase
LPDLKVHAPFEPTGDQPQAIAGLIQGIGAGLKHQVLLGATGTGKTYAAAKLIESVNRPTLVMAHNKTLAAQLYQEFREFSRTTRSSTSSATTTISSRRPTCRARTRTSRRIHHATTRSTGCGTTPPERSSSDATW